MLPMTHRRHRNKKSNKFVYPFLLQICHLNQDPSNPISNHSISQNTTANNCSSHAGPHSDYYRHTSMCSKAHSDNMPSPHLALKWSHVFPVPFIPRVLRTISKAYMWKESKRRRRKTITSRRRTTPDRRAHTARSF